MTGRKKEGEEQRIVPNKNRELQIAPTKGKRFDAARKKVFLEWFAGTANLSLSARKAGVHYRTVLRHRMEKPAFREDFDRALEQAKPRLRAWLMEANDKGEEPIAFDEAEPAGGDPSPANLDTGQAMQLLRDDAQRLRAAGGPGGRGALGRVPSVASNEEVRRELVRRLKVFGIRVRAERAAPDGGQEEADGE